ncbi:MAG: spore maturation protein [Rhodothermales bacterium]
MEIFRTVLDVFTVLVLPAIIVGFPLYGLIKKVPVYEEFVEGAKDGFRVAVMIIPYLVAILFAIGMFRASGAMDFLVTGLEPLLGAIGIPPEILPMGIIRPLTGSGSAGIVVDMINTYGEDSVVVKIAATMFGSTETTFYVIAVYFGAVNIKKTRHAVPAGLLADFTAMLVAIYLIQFIFGWVA